VIYGVGTDLIEIPRIEAALRRFGARFAQRILNLRSGKPALEFSPDLRALMDARGVGHAHLSLTDERTLAGATVVLEAHA